MCGILWNLCGGTIHNIARKEAIVAAVETELGPVSTW